MKHDDDTNNPWRHTVEPTTAPEKRVGSTNATREEHPAYATISANRVSGDTELFQSDFKSNGYITIAIHKAHVTRDLSHDWVHSDGEMIKVQLSEAQWATFVSAMNIGTGVPCTLRHVDRVPVPGIKRVKHRREQFRAESEHAVQESLQHLDKLRATIQGMGLTKAKTAELLSGVEMARRGVASSQNYIAKQFSEHMENTVEHAKAEVSGYVNGSLRQLGLQALAQKAVEGGEPAPLRLTLSED